MDRERHDRARAPRLAALAIALVVLVGGLSGTPAGSEDPPSCASGATDVGPTDAYCAEVAWSLGAGLIGLFPDGSFRPAQGLTRQAASVFLHRFAGEPPLTPCTGTLFIDVPATNSFCDEIEWAVGAGLLEGGPDGRFRPIDVFARGTFALALHLLAGQPGSTVELLDAIVWASEGWIIDPAADGTFAPEGVVSRGAMVAAFYRVEGLPPTPPSAPTGVSAVRSHAASEDVRVVIDHPVSSGGAALGAMTIVGSPGDHSETLPWTRQLDLQVPIGVTSLRFQVEGEIGASALSAALPIFVRTVPGAPTGAVAIEGHGEASVGWAAPGNDGGAPITGYRATASPGGAFCETTGLSCVVPGLTNGVSYTFTVVASNEVGPSIPSSPSAPVTPYPTFCGSGKPGPFEDVAAADPFCSDIEWLVHEGVAGGYPDGTYRPGAPVTRLSMALFLYRLAGSPNGEDPPCFVADFEDISLDHPYCAEVRWLNEEWIAFGYEDGTFRPGEVVTRQAMAAFLNRFADAAWPTFPCQSAAFVDVPKQHRFCPQIAWLVDEGITTGYEDGTFRPTGVVTRRSMAAFLRRLTEPPLAP
jgi:hypothetical protein